MRRFPGKVWLMLVVLFQAAAGFAGGIGASVYYYENRIIPGVEVGHIPLERLTYEDARDKLLTQLVLPSSITLTWDDRTFSVPLHSGISALK